jgi:ATP-dependent exoDNAse (exonuclease V) alpha subunit
MSTLPPLNPEQRRVFEGVCRDIRAGKSTIIVHGLAGTGKTTILCYLKREFPEAFLCTQYGKAAGVLRHKTGCEASTIDSAIHTFVGFGDDGGKQKMLWEDKVFHRRLVFLDEASVVGTKAAVALLAKCDQVVAFGDPGQLKPIDDVPFFLTADYLLTEIVRQAEDSPIIAQAHAVLETGKYRTCGPKFQVAKELTPDLLDADVILCHTNAQRHALNKRKRQHLGIIGPILQTGEPLMCLRNMCPSIGIYNGSVVRLREPWKFGQPLLLTDDQGRQMNRINNPTIEGFDPDFAARQSAYDKDKRKYLFHPFALAYACTVHKAQGSEWPSVLLVDGYIDNYNNTMYTGITRGRDRVVIINPKAPQQTEHLPSYEEITAELADLL